MNKGAFRLYGRSSSHYTRLTRIFALEAGVEVDHAHTPLTSLEAEAYGGHPALKLPVLHVGAEHVYGAENICRRLVRSSPRGLNVVWPETLQGADFTNAQELVWGAMQAQVQLVLGLQVAGLPADSPYFIKTRAGLHGALDWLDGRIEEILAKLPERDISLLETSLYCLVEHLVFRNSVEPAGYCRLMNFCAVFGRRASAQATPYRVDSLPSGASSPLLPEPR